MQCLTAIGNGGGVKTKSSNETEPAGKDGGVRATGRHTVHDANRTVVDINLVNWPEAVELYKNLERDVKAFEKARAAVTALRDLNDRKKEAQLKIDDGVRENRELGNDMLDVIRESESILLGRKIILAKYKEPANAETYAADIDLNPDRHPEFEDILRRAKHPLLHGHIALRYEIAEPKKKNAAYLAHLLTKKYGIKKEELMTVAGWLLTDALLYDRTPGMAEELHALLDKKIILPVARLSTESSEHADEQVPK
jgi:hypothetical protein